MCSQANRLDELARAEREDGCNGAAAHRRAGRIRSWESRGAGSARAGSGSRTCRDRGRSRARARAACGAVGRTPMTQQMLEDVRTVQEASSSGIERRFDGIERGMDPDDVPRPRQRVSQRRRLVQRAPDDRIDDLGELRRMRRRQKNPESPSPAPPALAALPVPPAPDTQSRCGDREDIHAPRTRVGSSRTPRRRKPGATDNRGAWHRDRRRTATSCAQSCWVADVHRVRDGRHRRARFEPAGVEIRGHHVVDVGGRDERATARPARFARRPAVRLPKFPLGVENTIFASCPSRPSSLACRQSAQRRGNSRSNCGSRRPTFTELAEVSRMRRRRSTSPNASRVSR